ncbi:alpha/beta hydrolase, partial [Rhizobium ruizarguesonis]
MHQHQFPFSHPLFQASENFLMINHTSVYSMPGTCFFDLAPAAGGEPYRIFLS